MRSFVRWQLDGALLLVVAGCAHTSATKGANATVPITERTRFTVIRQGTDTVAVERFSRSTDRLDGEVTASDAPTVRYTLIAGADAAATHLEAQVVRGGSVVQRGLADFQGDSIVTVTTDSGGTARTARIPTTRGATPYMSPSVALLEQLIRRARAIGGSPVQVPVFVVGTGGRTTMANVEFVPGDSVLVTLGATRMRLAVNAAGQIIGGGVPSQGIAVRRAVEAP